MFLLYVICFLVNWGIFKLKAVLAGGLKMTYAAQVPLPVCSFAPDTSWHDRKNSSSYRPYKTQPSYIGVFPLYCVSRYTNSDMFYTHSTFSLTTEKFSSVKEILRFWNTERVTFSPATDQLDSAWKPATCTVAPRNVYPFHYAISLDIMWPQNTLQQSFI
jgi:hypothetical protein